MQWKYGRKRWKLKKKMEYEEEARKRTKGREKKRGKDERQDWIKGGKVNRRRMQWKYGRKRWKLKKEWK